MPPALRIKSLKKAYTTATGETLTIFNEFDLNIQERQITSIVGPSGCGKTTLLRIISGLESPDAGSVDPSSRGPSDRGFMVAYMFQQDRLLPWRTVRENALLGVEVRGRYGERAIRDALELLDYVGLGPFCDYYPHQLSQGMRQRVAFVRTLLIDAPVLLLDEPFSSVDYEVRLRLENYVLSYARNRRPTIVFVSHDLEEAIVLGQEIVVLSPQPAQVKHVYTINLPTERREALAVRQSDEFRRYLGILGAEVLNVQ